VGKSTLIQEVQQRFKGTHLLLQGEDMLVQQALELRTIANYKQLIGNHDLLIIDEAQHISDIGRKLKLMIDNLQPLRILVTGSSALDINKEMGEPLTGRNIRYMLYPFSVSEYKEHLLQRKESLSHRLIYGSYPELVHISGNEQKARYLRDLMNDYLLKDILIYQNIKNADKIFDLLQLIAFQVGSEVSYDELGNQLGMSKNTVISYLDLLSKVFILFKVRAYSRNGRKEISKKTKWYFYDNGIRNTIISNLNPMHLRNDQGTLWENYMISERLKKQSYTDMLVQNYFWRTYDQQELDWIEDRGGKLHAYELKWNTRKKAKIPTAFAKNYPDSNYEVITPDNYYKWIEMTILG